MNPAQGIEQGYEAWKQYGLAGLFVFIFLCLFFYHFYSERRYVALVNNVASVLEKSNSSHEAETKALDLLKLSVDKQASQSAEFLSYLKGRDSNSKGGPV